MKYNFDTSWMDNSPLRELIFSIEREGGVAYLVGGCIRNGLLGKDVLDFDIATDVLPDQIIKIAEKNGYRVIKTGINYGTVTIINRGTKFEVTTFRSDIKTDGRTASVEFTSQIELDAMRRDFTMNSIYMTISGKIIDPLDSLDDLWDQRITFIGNPSERINEDKLRILRFFRFLAEFDKGISDIDSATMAALKKYKRAVKFLSRERIWMEIERILSVPKPQKTFKIMNDIGILDEILPPIEVDGLSALATAEKKFNIAASPLIRLFSLNKNVGEKWSDYLNLSNNEANFLENIRKSLKHCNDLMAVAYKFGKDVAEGWLLNLNDRSFNINPNEISRIINFGINASFPLSGKDLLEEFEEGPELGKQLVRLERLWVKSRFTMSKTELISKLKS